MADIIKRRTSNFSPPERTVDTRKRLSSKVALAVSSEVLQLLGARTPEEQQRYEVELPEAEKLMEVQIATCRALAMAIHEAVKALMWGGSNLQGVASTISIDSFSLDAMLEKEALSIASAGRAVLSAFSGLGEVLVGLASSVTRDILEPLEDLVKQTEEAATKGQSELAQLDQYEDFCLAALNESAVRKEKVSVELQGAMKERDAAERSRFRWLSGSTLKKADAKLQAAAHGQTAAVEEIATKVDEVAVARARRDQKVNSLCSLFKEVDSQRHSLMRIALVRCGFAWDDMANKLREDGAKLPETAESCFDESSSPKAKLEFSQALEMRAAASLSASKQSQQSAKQSPEQTISNALESPQRSLEELRRLSMEARKRVPRLDLRKVSSEMGLEDDNDTTHYSADLSNGCSFNHGSLGTMEDSASSGSGLGSASSYQSRSQGASRCEAEIVYYLPKETGGIPILKHEGGLVFRLDKSQVESRLRDPGEGVALRLSKDLTDKSQHYLGWGERVVAIDDGDGWIRMDREELGRDLPFGWEVRESRSRAGILYFANPQTGASQLERPTEDDEDDGFSDIESSPSQDELAQRSLSEAGTPMGHIVMPSVPAPELPSLPALPSAPRIPFGTDMNLPRDEQDAEQGRSEEQRHIAEKAAEAVAEQTTLSRNLIEEEMARGKLENRAAGDTRESEARAIANSVVEETLDAEVDVDSKEDIVSDCARSGAGFKDESDDEVDVDMKQTVDSVEENNVSVNNERQVDETVPVEVERGVEAAEKVVEEMQDDVTKTQEQQSATSATGESFIHCVEDTTIAEAKIEIAEDRGSSTVDRAECKIREAQAVGESAKVELEESMERRRPSRDDEEDNTTALEAQSAAVDVEQITSAQDRSSPRHHVAEVASSQIESTFLAPSLREAADPSVAPLWDAIEPPQRSSQAPPSANSESSFVSEAVTRSCGSHSSSPNGSAKAAQSEEESLSLGLEKKFASAEQLANAPVLPSLDLT